MGIRENYNDMAKRLGISKDEVVKKIRTLEKMGFVTVVKQQNGEEEIFVHFYPNTAAV